MSEQMREFQGSGMQASPAALPCPNGQLYTVRSGDTLFFIARRNNISLQSLIEANPQLTDPNTIFPGQIICIPTAGMGLPCPNGRIYRVVRGDTMFEIARRNNISLTALIAANPQIANPNLILPGQEICIPAAVTEEPIPRPVPTPLPVPMPEEPIPMPMPIQPIPPMVCPTPSMPVPVRPMPPSGIIQEAPLPYPMTMPCPPREYEMGPMCPMPFYIRVPWEECPYRARKKKKRHCKSKCH